MRQFLAATFLALAGAVPLAAQQSPVVVELFTSQGCSSCPPADALLHDLAARDDVIALALHVDYWDYIGWTDPYGDPAHAARQRRYAAVAGRTMIYTPQMIVGGVTDVVGAKPMKLAEAIAAQADRAPRVSLTLVRANGVLRIEARTLGASPGTMQVHLVRYSPLETTRIARGENGGKTLSYANVVRDWTTLGDWDGSAPYEASVPVPGDDPSVVLVQRSGPGPILAAARLR